MGSIACGYRAPDEKTIRVVLDRPARGPWPVPCSGQGRAQRGAPAGHPRPACAATVLGAAVDGKTSRGARRADGTRVHPLGVAGHGGYLLDHLEVGVKHNETSHVTELLMARRAPMVPR